MFKSNITPWNGGFELAGKTFTRLYVIQFLRVQKRKKIWQCRCVCGTICEAMTSALVNGGKKSCGCLRRDSCTNTVEDFWSKCLKTENGNNILD